MTHPTWFVSFFCWGTRRLSIDPELANGMTRLEHPPIWEGENQSCLSDVHARGQRHPNGSQLYGGFSKKLKGPHKKAIHFDKSVVTSGPGSVRPIGFVSGA